MHPGQFVHRTTEAPGAAELADGEVIVRLCCGAICGSDLPRFRGRYDLAPNRARDGYPLHEVVGVIVESRSSDLAAGDRVAGYATDARGFSQYFINSGTQLVPVTSHLSDRDLVVVQPLATVLNAFSRVGNVAGYDVAVIGQGPLGLLWSHVLKSAGAARVVGVDQVDRSDVASAFGVDHAVWDISSNWAASLKAEERYRLVVEAVGHQVGTLNDAISAVAFEGHVSAFGVPDDPYYPIAFLELFRKNASLTSGITSDWRRFLRDALEYLERYPELPGAYITHEFSPVEAQRAYECASTPAAGRLKVVVLAEA